MVLSLNQGRCSDISTALFQQSLNHNLEIRSFTLGKLVTENLEPQTATYDDIFTFLEQLPALAELNIVYHPVRHA